MTIVLSFAAHLNIDAADDVDPSFVSRLFGGLVLGTGVESSTVRSVVLQPDGKMLVGGDLARARPDAQYFRAFERGCLA